MRRLEAEWLTTHSEEPANKQVIPLIHFGSIKCERYIQFVHFF